MSVVLGFDVGRHLGYGLVDYDDGSFVAAGTVEVTPAGASVDDQCGQLGGAVRRIWNDHQHLHIIEVAVEKPFIHGRNASGADTLLMLHGALRLAVWRINFGCAQVPPSTLKKHATGNGRSDKSAMRLAAARRWPDLPILGHDAIDALWVADWARVETITRDGGVA